MSQCQYNVTLYKWQPVHKENNTIYNSSIETDCNVASSLWILPPSLGLASTLSVLRLFPLPHEAPTSTTLSRPHQHIAIIMCLVYIMATVCSDPSNYGVFKRQYAILMCSRYMYNFQSTIALLIRSMNESTVCPLSHKQVHIHFHSASHGSVWQADGTTSIRFKFS